MLRVRNKNAILELLKAGSRFEKIVVANNLREDDQTKKILALADKKGVKVERSARSQIDKRRTGDSREVLLGFLVPDDFWTLKQLLDDL
ncbi:MAG: RNA methyltransferase substrate-binding domain-containing protein, partial [Patescibacteria group bacterium]